MPTRIIGVFDGGNVRVEIDYDASRRITALRCVNGSGLALYAEAVQVSNRRKYASTFLPNSTTEIPVPTGTAQRLQLVLNAQGRLDGVEYAIVYPAAP